MSLVSHISQIKIREKIKQFNLFNFYAYSKLQAIYISLKLELDSSTILYNTILSPKKVILQLKFALNIFGKLSTT